MLLMRGQRRSVGWLQCGLAAATLGCCHRWGSPVRRGGLELGCMQGGARCKGPGGRSRSGSRAAAGCPSSGLEAELPQQPIVPIPPCCAAGDTAVAGRPRQPQHRLAAAGARDVRPAALPLLHRKRVHGHAAAPGERTWGRCGGCSRRDRPGQSGGWFAGVALGPAEPLRDCGRTVLPAPHTFPPWQLMHAPGHAAWRRLP